MAPEMSEKQKSYFVEAVERKGVRIPIYCAPVGNYESFLLSYYQNKRRKQERAKTLPLARQRAQELVEELTAGTVHIGTLSAKQHAVVAEALEIAAEADGETGMLEAVRQFFEAKKLLEGKTTVLEACRGYMKEMDREKLPEISFPDLVEKFLVWVKAEKSRRYKLDMQARLHSAAKNFTGNIADIKTADIDTWLAGMAELSGRTKNNYRNAIRTLFRFGRDKNYLPRDMKTEVEFSSRYTPAKTEIGIYTNEQLEILLTRICPRMLPVVALGAFAGLRAAEISRLEWKHIRFEKNVIVVPVTIAKTSNRRLAPILPALAAWLKPFRKDSGKVLVRVGDEFALTTLFKKGVDAITGKDGKPLVEIVQNGLRHSYISYRVAAIKNVHQVSLEAGNSPRVIFSSYRELVEDENRAEQWFKIMPTKARLKEITAAIAAGL
jgi:integrase